MVTLRDVAERASVSTATVSRVLRGSQTRVPISEETRRRVLQASEELDYQPNAAARSLVSRCAGTIALLIPPRSQRLGYKFFFHLKLPEFLSGVEEITSAAGYRLLLQTADDSFVRGRGMVRLWRSRIVDGFLQYNTEQMGDLRALECPALTVNFRAENVLDNYIVADHIAGASAAVNHLVSLGHRRIAYIKGANSGFVTAERTRGYYQAIAAHGLEPLVMEGDFTEENGYLATQALMARTEPPTAIFAGSDLMAIGVIRAVFDSGLKVPQDMAVIGSDGIELTGYTNPPLTTVLTPMIDMARLATTRLLELIKGERAAPVQEVIQTRLVLRRSCGYQGPVLE
ncbi:MAG: LacI family DNA-binding transcriptional regulator [Candidatus Atribacteria bacterium]|nr:LacI family DNA-binding transcriptional regulator [Candidatus Atribacteria bacterium]